MRVLIVVSALTYGGAERQVVLLSRAMSEAGHSVMIYTLNDQVPRANELLGSRVELVVDQKRSRLDFAVLRRLRRCILGWKPDVVHGFLFDGDLYSRLAAINLSVPVLNSERNDAYQRKRSQTLAFRLTSRFVDGVIANSYAGKRFAEHVHRISADRVDVVWNGIDLDEVDRRTAVDQSKNPDWPGTDTKKIVVVVGALKPQKDYVLAIQVAEALFQRDASFRFLMVGEGLSLSNTSKYKEQVLEHYRQSACVEAMKFLGPRTDVYEIMAQAGVLLVTSHFEGFPNVVLEAMSVGLPVATTDYSDIRRIVPNAWQVASQREPGQLADIVQRCVEQRDEVAREQRSWVEEHAKLSVAAQHLIDVYKRYADVRNVTALSDRVSSPRG